MSNTTSYIRYTNSYYISIILRFVLFLLKETMGMPCVPHPHTSKHPEDRQNLAPLIRCRSLAPLLSVAMVASTTIRVSKITKLSINLVQDVRCDSQSVTLSSNISANRRFTKARIFFYCILVSDIPDAITEDLPSLRYTFQYVSLN